MGFLAALDPTDSWELSNLAISGVLQHFGVLAVPSVLGFFHWNSTFSGNLGLFHHADLEENITAGMLHTMPLRQCISFGVFWVANLVLESFKVCFLFWNSITNRSSRMHGRVHELTNLQEGFTAQLRGVQQPLGFWELFTLPGFL